MEHPHEDERILFVNGDCKVTRGMGTIRYVPVLTTRRLVLLGEAWWRDWLWGLCHFTGIIGAAIGFGGAGSALSSWPTVGRLVVQIGVAVPLGYLLGYLLLALLIRLLLPSVVKFGEQLSHVLKNPNAKWVDRAKEHASHTLEYSLRGVQRLAVEQRLAAPCLSIEQGDGSKSSFRAKPEGASALSRLAEAFVARPPAP